YDIGTQGTATVTVTDNDIANVTFTSTPANPKVGQSFTLTATIDKMIQVASNPIEYTDSANESYFYIEDSDSDGIAGNPASERSVVVEDGFDVAKSFTVNTAGEYTHDFFWVDQDEGFAETQFPDTTATITIAAAADIDLSLSVDANTKAEGESVTVTVTADSALAAATSVPITVASAGTLNGKSSASDVTGGFTDRAVTIAANGTSGTVSIAVADDSIIEPNETFTINIGTPPTGTARKSGDTAETITITDNDVAVVTYTPNPANPVTGQPFTLTVTLDKMIQAAVAPADRAAFGPVFGSYTSRGNNMFFFRDTNADGVIGTPATELTDQVFRGSSDPITFTRNTAGQWSGNYSPGGPGGGSIPAGFTGTQFPAQDFDITIGTPNPLSLSVDANTRTEGQSVVV
ncbi:MAG: hypothetical protein MPJ79_07450, partial [Alphaproteobacteria bacterium]|nr:hypothetical protein [Alphaproteobacteria bacterium]